MKLTEIFKLLNAIDVYYSDFIKLKIPMPGNKIGMKIRAISSFVFYGTSFSEYFAYKFWLRSREEKRTYMTRRYMFKFFDKYNPAPFRERIGNKSVSPKFYGKFLKREQFNYSMGYDEFEKFCQKYKKLFVKKSISWGGQGSFVINTEMESDYHKFWNLIDDDYVVEPLIVNEESIERLHPDSLNTVKVTVLLINGKPEIQYALFRMGNGTCVDNVHLGGMGAGVNIVTGIVETMAVDKHFNKYSVHPKTKQKILGFRMPEWDQVCQLACEASLVTPELRYTSWDIAVTGEGPVLLEGNWDAEFYAEQMIYETGNRLLFEGKLDGNNE